MLNMNSFLLKTLTSLYHVIIPVCNLTCLKVTIYGQQNGKNFLENLIFKIKLYLNEILPCDGENDNFTNLKIRNQNNFGLRQNGLLPKELSPPAICAAHRGHSSPASAAAGFTAQSPRELVSNPPLWLSAPFVLTG